MVVVSTSTAKLSSSSNSVTLAAAFVLFMIIFACTLFNKLYLEKKVHYS